MSNINDNQVFDLVEGGEKIDLFPTDKVRPLPALTKVGHKALKTHGPFEDITNYQLIWNMVIDEYGFDPETANKWNIFKLATIGQVTEDSEMFDQFGKDLESIFNIEPDKLEESDGMIWSVSKGQEHVDVVKNRVITTLEGLDKKYDIYKDEGIALVKDLILNDKITLDNMRDLYQNKYKKIYGEIPENE